MTDKTKYDWLVVGGGYKSLVAAYSFAKQGQSVLLLERGDALGGFMSPIRWGDFWIDKGPQFFDNFEENDRAFMVEMVGEDVFEDIGFKYSSFLNGQKTDGFAIPDWRAHGSEFTAEVFKDLVQRQVGANSANGSDYASFADLLAADGGQLLTPILKELTQKFTRRDAGELSPHARRMATFVGRKLLFDQEVSLDLKKSEMLDGLLAAQKKAVAETRFNLYPKGSNLETVRAAMERAVREIGVEVITGCGDIKVHTVAKICDVLDRTVHFGRAFFGCDAREAEALLFGTDALLQQTHMLPEIFHCFSVPAEHLDEAYYLVDYDTDHLSTRMTNFSNYMNAYDDEGYGVFCIEQAIDKDSADWNDPSATQDRVFREAQEAGNITCETYKAAKSFRIPVTYKVPLAGYVDAAEDLAARTEQAGGGDLIIPNPMSLTRKETLEDLRALDLLAEAA